jgi:hypothetical protein
MYFHSLRAREARRQASALGRSGGPQPLLFGTIQSMKHVCIYLFLFDLLFIQETEGFYGFKFYFI